MKNRAALYHRLMAAASAKIIDTTLSEVGGSQTRAACVLGLCPTYLNRLIRNHRLHLREAKP